MALVTAQQYNVKKLKPVDAVEVLKKNEVFMSALNEYRERIKGGVDFLEPLDVTYVGNNHKIKQTIQVLEMKRNPVCMLVADAGEGKTTTVKHLMEVVNQQKLNLNLEHYYVVFKMSITHIKALGLDKLEKAMEEMLGEMKRLQDIAIKETGIKELRFVAFFDESHKLIRIFGTQSKQGGDTLKESLTPAKVRVICATTRNEYDRTFATDEPLDDRFEMVELDRTGEEQLLKILQHTWQDLKKKPPFYPIDDLSPELMINIAFYTSKFLPNKQEPRRSTKFLELLESKCRIENRQPSIEVVKEIFLEKRNSIDPQLDFHNGIRHLREDLVGQELAKMQLEDYLFALKARVQQRDDKPIGSAFFAGPTGVGKTECAKILNKYFLQSTGDIIFVDVPSYANDPNGGKLMLADLGQAVHHNPTSLILIDEFEKGVPSKNNNLLKTNLQPLFLSLLNEGIIKYEIIDSEGQPKSYKQSLRNTFWIFTSNAGYETFENEDKTGEVFEYANISEAEAVSKRSSLEDSIEKRFQSQYKISREFLGRIGVLVVFTGLGKYNATLLAKRYIEHYLETYAKENNIRFDIADKHRYKKSEIEGAHDDCEFQELAVFIGVTKGDMDQSSKGGARRVGNVVAREIIGKIGRAEFEYETEQLKKGVKIEDVKLPNVYELKVKNNGLNTNGFVASELFLEVRLKHED